MSLARIWYWVPKILNRIKFLTIHPENLKMAGNDQNLTPLFISGQSQPGNNELQKNRVSPTLGGDQNSAGAYLGLPLPGENQRRNQKGIPQVNHDHQNPAPKRIDLPNANLPLSPNPWANLLTLIRALPQVLVQFRQNSTELILRIHYDSRINSRPNSLQPTFR